MTHQRPRLLWLTAVLLSYGCDPIRFVADTEVDADGTVVRATQMLFDGWAPDTIKAEFDLPPGGEWTESSYVRKWGKVSRQTYSLTRQYARGEPLPVDFRHHGYVKVDRAAHNEIRVRSQQLWFVDLFSYRETFRDIATRESFISGVNRLYLWAVERAAERISAADPTITLEQARDRLMRRLDPLIHSVTTDCFDAPEISLCFAELQEEYGERFIDDEVSEAEILRIFPAPEPVDADDWLATLTTIRDEVLSQVEDLLVVEFAADICGHYCFWPLEESAAAFELSVRLPGELVATNADSNESGVLKWKFDGADLWLRDKTLHASSRVIHYGRIKVAVVILLLGGIVALTLFFLRT